MHSTNEKVLGSRYFQVLSPLYSKQKKEENIISTKRKSREREDTTTIVDKVNQFLSNEILPTFLSRLETKYNNEEKVSNEPIILLLGVSGGCDSIALLHCMMNLVTKITEHNDNIHVFRSNSTSPSDNGEIEEAVNNFPLARFQTHVVHFDHQQRGEASNSDRIFVQNLCKEMKIPFHCYFWEDELNYRNDIDVNDDDKRFSQEKARNWRMQNMRTLLSDLISDSNLNAGLILTAHHADDSDETLLLKLLRGAHVTNLSGIEPILFTSYNHPLTATARPLLTLRKEEIIDYLTAHDLKWREDESNKSSKYLRNRVRNELLPLINDMVGGKGIFQVRMIILLQHWYLM